MSNHSFITANMLKIRMHLIIICALLFSMMPMSIVAQTEVDRAEVRRQIAFHRQWMAEHTPNPQTLNDSALIIETVRAIHTVCHEPQVGAMIRHAGKVFGLRELEDYAALRDRQGVDRDDAQANRCLQLLAEEAHKRLGEASYPQAYTEMIWGLNAESYEQAKERYHHFHSIAKQLYEREPTAVNHEIWLMAQVVIRTVEGYYGENPTVYRDLKVLTQKVFDLYKEHRLQTDVQVLLLKVLDDYHINSTLYENYYALVNRELLLTGVIPRNQSLQPEDLGLSRQSDGNSSVPARLLAQLLHPNHPDVMAMQVTDNNIWWYGEEALLQRLKFIQEYLREYSAESNLLTMSAKRAIRGWQIIHQTAIEDTDFSEDWDIMKRYLSETSSVYLSTLSDEVEILLLEKSDLLNDVVNSLDSLVAVVAGGDPIRKMQLNYYQVSLQRSGIPGHEYSFYDRAQQYLDCCDDYPTWNTVTLGKLMVLDALMLGDANTAMMLQRRLTSLARTIAGEQDPIFVTEYLRYGQLARDNVNRAVTTLDGQQGADSLFADLIRCAPAAQVEANAYLCAGPYYFHRGQQQRGRAYLQKALALFEEQAARQSPADSSFIESNRYNLASVYANLLHSYLAEHSSEHYNRDSVDYYGSKLEELVQQMDFSPTLNFQLFYQLSEYYGSIGALGQAKKLLHDCLSYYDSMTGNRVDGYYLQILQALINISAYWDNDMDECQALAERLERDILGFENTGSFENYISLLRTLYDLIEAKNPYDQMMLTKYLRMLENAITAYIRASNGDEDVVMNHGLYFMTKLLNRASMHDQLRMMYETNGTDMELFDRDWETMRDNVTNQLVPQLQEMRNRLEGQPGYKTFQAERYYQIIMCQAQAAEYCMNDTAMAEKYYRELADGAGVNGLMLLGQYYMKRGRINDALPIFQQIDALFHDPQGFDMQNPTANLRGKINTVGSIFLVNYLASRYTDALRLAREYQQHLSTYISQNFDLMTQNEREALLNGFGSGSMPLLKLLPHMPEQLAADCYDAALRDKGILLRASDRIQQAIAASGNDTLIHAVDSLRMMQQQLGAIQGTDQQAQSRFADLRDQMDRLERYIARKAAAFKSEEDAVPTWQQVRGKLRKDEAAVEFVMTDSAMMALVLTPEEEQPEFVFLMGPEEAPRLQEMLTGKTPAELSSSLYGKGHTYVYEKFWQPLEAHFHGATKIYFSPTGFLNSFSFAAFTLPDNSYLIDHYELHQLTTTARLAYRDSRKKAQKKSKTAQVYGALYYNEEQQEYYEPKLAEMRHAFLSDNLLAQNGQERGQAESFPYLENSLYEADAITSLLKEEGVSTQEHIGVEPIEQAIRKMSGNSPDILLISTHGFFYNDIQEAIKVPYLQKRQNALNPMTTTGLILADGERAWQGEPREDECDNILSSQEVASMNLTGTQLAVLSACETGLGASNMEGVYGLQRGFKQAGVRSLCASLWSVNDLSTAQLMQSFFRQWLSGKKGMTMQQAMITVMKEQRARTPEPYYWAPFVIYDADF